MSILEEDQRFFKEYRKKRQKDYEFISELAPWALQTDEDIRRNVPSKKQADKRLLQHAYELLSLAKKCKSSARVITLRRYAALLKEPDFRSRRAAKIIAREKRRAEREIKTKKDIENDLDERAARKASKYGFDGKVFRAGLDLNDESTQSEILKCLSKQIEYSADVIEEIGKRIANETEEAKPGTTRGRKRIYTAEKLKDMHNLYKECREQGMQSGESWHYVAEELDLKSGDAARVACNQHKNKLK